MHDYLWKKKVVFKTVEKTNSHRLQRGTKEKIDNDKTINLPSFSGKVLEQIFKVLVSIQKKTRK